MIKVKEQINNIEGTKTEGIKEILKEYTILKLVDEYNYMSYTKGNKKYEQREYDKYLYI